MRPYCSQSCQTKVRNLSYEAAGPSICHLKPYSRSARSSSSEAQFSTCWAGATNPSGLRMWVAATWQGAAWAAPCMLPPEARWPRLRSGRGRLERCVHCESIRRRSTRNTAAPLADTRRDLMDSWLNIGLNGNLTRNGSKVLILILLLLLLLPWLLLLLLLLLLQLLPFWIEN